MKPLIYLSKSGDDCFEIAQLAMDAGCSVHMVLDTSPTNKVTITGSKEAMKALSKAIDEAGDKALNELLASVS